MSRYSSYVICTSPRSGSTLLCDLLSQTGRAGNPGSWFHAPELEKWLGYFDLSAADFPNRSALLKEIFARARAKGTEGKSMFGLRLQRRSAPFFFDRLADAVSDQGTDVARFNALFGRTLFIHLTRPDKLAQAVSFVKAQQSGLWHRGADGEALEQLPPTGPLGYDEDRIAHQITEFEGFDLQWHQWFEDQNLSPLAISYDDLAFNPLAILADVLGQLGQDPTHKTKQPSLVTKLADATNEDWIARYRNRAMRR